MPRVKITIGDLKCVRQADNYGKDDVYWLSNLRRGTAVDQIHTDTQRDYFMTAEEARDYGLVDTVVSGMAGERVRRAGLG